MTDKIEPALTDEEWAEGTAYVWVINGELSTVGPFVQIEGNRLVVVDDDYYTHFTARIDRPEAMIAAANAALPDSDPRKITREMVRFLREDVEPAGADRCVNDAEAAAVSAEYEQLEAIAAALESYLPPEKPTV